MGNVDISSPSNEQVKRLVRLRRRRHRDEEGIFVVEEERILRRALDAGHRPTEVYLCPDLRDPIEGLTHRTMSREAIDKASYRGTSTGLIALFPYFDRSLETLEWNGQSLFLVAEGVEKPGNLGAMLRVADAAGVAGLILVDTATDVFNPNAVRASTGAIFTVPVARAGLDETVELLRDRRIMSVAAHPGAGPDYWDLDMTGPVAIWVGAEADGLSTEARSQADALVSIPMRGAADSLNTSIAASLVLYESVRQRSQAKLS
ncbi:MAG: RNA methyltransferase [Actinobacteria bacterium]|nr:MAG: RNA methyltransferase [Actinomycetota bacterium]